MTKFLSFLGSRQFLAFAALVIAALAIWFAGPLIAFGGLKPLADIGMRVFVIALLLVWALLWLAEFSMSPVVAALVCVLIWYASPLLTFGRSTPFTPESVRLAAIVVVLALFIVYWIYRLWRRMREDEQFTRQLLQFGGKKAPSPAAARLVALNAIVLAALSRLKTMRTGARGLGRLFQGKRYLYELPWYITLGANASGKTSALLGAGLPLPIGEQLQRAAGGGETAPVEWWLTNSAMLIDTTGYYTQHGTSTAVLSTPTGSAQSVDGEGKGETAKGVSSEPEATGRTQTESVASPSATVSVLRADTTDHARRLTIDHAEWMGFLEMLRKHRPRAPINGALITVDLAQLINADTRSNIEQAGALRARLAELREELGIRFPVYLLIAKMDRLSGFDEYFGSLTAEGRAQAWGFTLPYGRETIAREGIRARCAEELGLLASRLADGVNTRLQDEYDGLKRRKLMGLSEEFAALAPWVCDWIERVFLDSRYDDTQLQTTLRGVYFTSAKQEGTEIAAQRRTVAQRLMASLGLSKPALAQHAGNQSFFLHDLLTKVVIPEAHLVRPNLRWEFRFQVLRLVGHTLALVLFAWLAIGLRASFGNNSEYLGSVQSKAVALAAHVTQLYKAPKPEAVPDALTEARYLPTYSGLDLSNPDAGWRYGLYTPPEIVDEGHHVYDALQDNLLLPQIVRRMEDVIAQSIASKNPKAAYDALRVYLMLYDKAKFNAGDVKAWVLDDWARSDSAAVFGGRATMIDHVQQLFSGRRLVQSPLIRNDALIQQARDFLDGSNATERLYERAKAAMLKEAPDEFTLLRAVGPQAGTVFTRASGAPLSRGVPGLFTYEGYRNLFDKRLPEFAQVARDDDVWVMGRSYLGTAQKKTVELVSAATGADDPLTEAIRRTYLLEYAHQWDAFLGDIRTVTGTSLAFDLQVLRSFAAPDSPLARLARAAARETALAQSAAQADGSFLQKATDQLSQKADKALGIRASERIERELVDQHFAALREVVTGTAEARSGSQPSSQVGKTGLDGVVNLLNDYYTALTVADNALSNNSMPPSSDTAAKLKMTAETMPAPFREVLRALAADGSREVNEGIGQLLSRQMEAGIGDTCRLTVAGSYPFAPESRRDIGMGDFTRLFAQGGVLDDFFTKTLAPYVDTLAKPWRYKTLPGATEPVQGPDLEPFQHAKAIRDVFFADAGQKQATWKADIRVTELDPTVTSLAVDIDGQAMLYQHGPVAPFTVSWPGPRGGTHAEITASPRIRPDTSTIALDGPWALMRLLQKGRVADAATPGRTRVTLDFDGRKAVLDLTSAGSTANPLTSDLLRSFRCPSSVPVFPTGSGRGSERLPPTPAASMS